MIASKPFEIFCGTGGVGKTTLATSRGINLAMQGKKVLVITIDPAKRLKEVLKMDESNQGQVEDVSGIIDHNPQNGQLHALLLSPLKTLERIASENSTEKEFLNNYIIKVLSRPYGGMNEILGVVELQHHIQNGHYDTIILDTPPGKHFIDFLNSCEKINKFFDKSFMDIFKYLGKKVSDQDESSGLIKIAVKTGVKKLLSLLERVTGGAFVNDFIDAIAAIYQNKNSFLNALKFQDQLKKVDFSNWYLVTSIEHYKIKETKTLENQASGFIHNETFILVNKCLQNFLDEWQVEDQNPVHQKLKQSMQKREKDILENISNSFPNVLKFPDILDSSPQTHVLKLAEYWQYK